LTAIKEAAMTATRSAVLLVVLSAGPVAAQPKVGQAQPDRLPLGTLHVGATAEASVMVWAAGNNANAPVQVTAPKFVKVLGTSTEPCQIANANFVLGTVEVAIDTSAVGELSGDLTVTVGNTTAKVPVSASVKPRKPGLSRLLVVGTPFERHTTQDAGDYRGWTDLVRAAPMDVSYLLVRRDAPVLRDLDLRRFDYVLLSADALSWQTPADVTRARAFAEGGGRVVVTANHFFQRTVPRANEVLAGYGLEMRDEEGPPGQGIPIGKNKLAAEVVKAGIASVHFFRPSPVAVTDPKLGIVLAAASGVGQPGDGFVAIAKAGRGEVVAVGQSLWWNWVSPNRAQGTDTAKFLRWLLLPPQRL
jgi:hypothetical protein